MYFQYDADFVHVDPLSLEELRKDVSQLIDVGCRLCAAIDTIQQIIFLLSIKYEEKIRNL